MRCFNTKGDKEMKNEQVHNQMRDFTLRIIQRDALFVNVAGPTDLKVLLCDVFFAQGTH